MNDIRLAVGVTDHPKTIRLIRKCGEGAYRCLQRLWLYARIYSPDGSLAGLDPEAVEIAAGWSGEVGLFYVSLKEIGWLDPDGGLHDWEEHQGWACGQKKRTRRAKEAARARWEKRFNGSSDAPSTATALHQAELSNAPSPIPSPIPSPLPNQNQGAVAPQKKKFVKPTVEEIRAYCEERKNGIDPQYFFDTNEGKGWVVGDTHTPMKDWKAVIRTWEQNRRTKPTGNSADNNFGHKWLV